MCDLDSSVQELQVYSIRRTVVYNLQHTRVNECTKEPAINSVNSRSRTAH